MDVNLELRESASLVESNGDGTFLMHLIRPCVGKGRGRHLYEADMLARDAGVFTGWKMYVDHEDPQARAKRGGLPRSVRELGGRVVESWWDPSVPAEGRFEQGAVVGRVKPTPFMRELVEADPDIVGVSINARATAVKPTVRNGQRVMLVEGIARDPAGSVDWVTEVGAGGKVLALRESVAQESLDSDLIDAMSRDEFLAYLEDRRPDLAEQFAEAAAEPDGDDEDDDDEDDGGKGRKCKSCGKRGCKGHSEVMESNEEDEMTPEQIREALQSPEARALIEAAVADAVAGSLEQVRAGVLYEARADFDRSLLLRDLRDAAHAQIAEAGLPEAFAASARAKFDLTPIGATEALDVMPVLRESDGGQEVEKDEFAVLREAVSAEIEAQKALVRAAGAPTLVEGLGDGAEEDEKAEAPAKPETRHLQSIIQECRAS